MIDERGLLLEESRQAHAAREVMNRPIVQKALAGMKQAVIDKWVATDAGAVEAREFCFHHYQAILKFEETFSEILQTGQLADAMLARTKE
jgi:hypothetical protein